MALFDKPIGQYMKSPVHVVPVDATLEEAERLLRDYRVSCLPVVGRDGLVAGVLSHSDLLQIGHVMARSIGGKELLRLPAMCAGDLMTTKVIAAEPDTTVAAASRTMRAKGIHRLFVIDQGKALGVFSARDVMTVLIEAKLKAPISQFMTTPALTIDAAEPLSTAAERLFAARVTGLVVIENGAPAGLFTQVEALAARELPKTTPVGEAAGYSLICLPVHTPTDRAAGFALATRARRVLALGPSGPNGIEGILTALDFAAAIAGE